MTSSLRTWVWALFLAVVFGTTLPTPAFPQTYVRSGLLIDWSDDTRFKDKNCSSQDPAALYGCGTGNDGAPLSSRGDFGVIPGLELGVGYVILPYLRLEAGMQYRPDFSFDGRANFTQLEPDARRDVTAELSSLSGMLAAYLDIGELLLFHYAPFGPFVGVGGGLSRIEIGETRMDFEKTSTIVPGGDHVGFSWMLTAGVSVSISPRMMLDVGWRYTDHGAVETSSGEGRIVWRDGSREPLELSLDKTRGHLRSHGLNASLRYTF